MRRRVAIVTTSYPREAGDPSGHFVQAEALELLAAGWDVHVLAPGPAVAGPRWEEGIARWTLGGAQLFGYPGAWSRARENPLRLGDAIPFGVRAALQLKRLGKLDLVQAHFTIPSGYPIALAAQAPLEVVAHGADIRLLAALPSRVSAHAVRTLLARGARFRFVAEQLRRSLLGTIAHDAALCRKLEERSRVAPAAIRMPDVALQTKAARARLGIAAGNGVWVVCGRLIASKRVDRALALARANDALLLVIGDGPERERLERFASHVGARARFLGMLPREEALGWIAAADRLVHLSEAEGAPTVVREARALGIPVLATPVGDVPAWAERDAGIQLFSASEAGDFRERIDQIR